ncbi:MAG TPA: imelysin family protein [Burkholderiaceae bacterium]|nr:imelysin family protein [Burkholderiaceae bacterium]
MPSISAYIHTWAESRGVLRTLSTGLAAIGLLCGAGVAGAGQLPADLGGKLVQGYIAPAMQQFQHSAEQMQAGLSAWCAAPAASGTDKLKLDFSELVEAWSGIEFLRFGPLVAANRYERIYFWPDPRGITLRQVRGLLGQADQPIPNAADLAAQSVALQGLPALEYVLYRKDGLLTPTEAQAAGGSANGGKNTARACAYATAVAGNLAAVGAELGGAWKINGDYARQFSAPSSTNALYRSQQEVAAEAIKALSTGLQFARDVKLMPTLGADIKAARHNKAPFWRSGLSAQAMAASVQGMLQFYKAGGYIYAEDEAWIDGSIQHELVQARDGLRSMRGDFKDLLKTEEGYRGLTLASLILKNAKGVIDENMAPAFGARIGFNALDGD